MVCGQQTVHKPPDHPELPPSLSLSPSLHLFSPLPPLSPCSPSAHPQHTICAVRLLWVCQSPSVLWLEAPLSLRLSSESRTPPRPVDPAAPPWLLAPSSPPWPISPPAPPGSLVPPAPPWSVVDHSPPRGSTPPATPCPSGSVRLFLPSGSTLVLCHSSSTVAFWIPAMVAGDICSALTLRILGVTLAHCLSISASGFTTKCSVAIGQTPGVISPSSTITPPSVSSTVGRHHGCGLGPAWFLLLQVPGLCSLSSFQDSVLHPILHLGCPLFMPALRPPLFPSHIHSFVFLLSPPPSLHLSLWREVEPSGRDCKLSHHRTVLLCFHPSCVHCPSF
ncbi:IgA FC receptor [Labeo rohita]|uniref:IgA FC receptor n=1 Tax=Labeo rohita TaxID=84645 RepID=A0ABQ8LH52_LABRO|nr:IgA FC receptor [Labeo rohita]